jgi:hypothetical protein
MTVVSALITKYGTAHASDSYITQAKAGGGRAVIEDQRTKLIYVKHWRGAMGYWGLGQYPNWSTLDWLQGRAQTASQFSDPEQFANALAADLNGALASLPLTPLEKGLGIHFTAYERIKDYWIPELFLISNWQGIPYTTLRPTGVGASRETFGTLNRTPPAPEHRSIECRMEVHEALLSGIMFGYNNGDPELFNPIANAIFQDFVTLSRRSVLFEPSSKEAHCALVRRPVEVVTRLLTDFARADTRVIGGKTHDLCILSNGEYWSSAGG